MKKTMILMLASTVILAGCGGGGSGSGSGSGSNVSTAAPIAPAPSPASIEFSGKVIDGYIQGATVCLDINNNYACDDNEPFSLSGIGGSYTFTFEGEIADGVQILADIPIGAVDEDLGVIDKPYNMLTPADNPGVITPLSTLVAQQVLDSGKTLSSSDAEKSVKLSLGIDETKSLLNNDFIENSDAEMQESATVIAEALAVIKETLVSDDVAAAELTPSEISKAAIKTLKDVIVTQLIANGSPTGNVEEVATQITTVVTGQVRNIVASTKSGNGEVVSLLEAIKSGEFISLSVENDRIDSNSNGIFDGEELYTFSEGLVMEFIYFPNATEDTIIKVDSETPRAFFPFEGNFSGTWYPSPTISDKYILINNEWSSASDSQIGAKVKDNCATEYDAAGEPSEEFCFISKNVSGKVLSDILPDACIVANGDLIAGCDPEAVLPAGSMVYDLTMTTSESSYGGAYATWYDGESEGYPSGEEKTVNGFIAAHTNNQTSFMGDACNTAFRIESYDPNNKTGVIEWADATNDTGCSKQFDWTDVGNTEKGPFKVIKFGETEVFQTKTSLIFRANNPDEFDLYQTFTRINDGNSAGIYSGRFTPAGTKISLPFTGNTDYGVFASKTMVDFVFEQESIPLFPYEQFLTD